MRLFTFFFLISTIGHAQVTDPNWIFGVTIDDPWTNTTGIMDAFDSHCQKPTSRIVFDENVAATDYTDAVNQIATKAFIMGEILDSYYVNTYTVQAYLNRTTEYLDEFENVVDIWEIGNEINGDWLGTTADVVQKMEGAYNLVKARNKPTALTLYYNNSCYYNHPENEMFTWVNANVPNAMKQGLDYVLVSYYEDDCENVVLTEAEWQAVFDNLHTIFPNSKLGMGECGTTDPTKKADYINRYYRMDITTPNYIGGYFWWYYATDCVPKTNALWTTIDATGCDHLALPVEYIEAFHGRANRQKIDLFWATSVELNADYFIVERLAPNGHWVPIQKVQPNQQHYHVIDSHPLDGENLYRLKQVDLDQHTSYSNTISFWFKQSNFELWPNPAHDIIHLDKNLGSIQHIQIKNLLNQTVLVKESPNNTLSISHLQPGLYMITLQGNQTITKPLIIY